MWPSWLVLQKKAFGYALYRPQRGTWGYRPIFFWENPVNNYLPSGCLSSVGACLLTSSWLQVFKFSSFQMYAQLSAICGRVSLDPVSRLQSPSICSALSAQTLQHCNIGSNCATLCSLGSLQFPRFLPTDNLRSQTSGSSGSGCKMGRRRQKWPHLVAAT